MRRVVNGNLVFSYLLIALAAVLRLAVSAPLNVVPVFSHASCSLEPRGLVGKPGFRCRLSSELMST